MLLQRAFSVAAIFLSARIASVGQPAAMPDNAVYAAAIRGDISLNARSIMVVSNLVYSHEDAQLVADNILAHDHYPGLNISAIDAPMLEAVKNYRTPVGSAASIKPDFAFPTPALFITKRQFNKFRRRNPDKGWRSFYKKYPGADGIFEFSPVGYSADRMRAVLYRAVRRNGLNGEGALLLLENTSSGWVIKQHINLWNN
jgi:hypothetical protein